MHDTSTNIRIHLRITEYCEHIKGEQSGGRARQAELQNEKRTDKAPSDQHTDGQTGRLADRQTDRQTKLVFCYLIKIERLFIVQ